MGLHMSVSSVQDFITCPRLYYYKRIKKYNRILYNLPFIVGRVVHEGLAAVLAKKPNAIELMTAVYRKERKEAIQAFTLSPEQLEELDMQEFTTKGMLLAYQNKYSVMIKDTQLLKSELEGAVDLGNDVTFVIKLDNVMLIRKKKILHELKTTKQITPDYVRRIKTNLQIGVYFYFHNIIWPDNKIEEILYDIIRKPGIRRKKGSKNIAPETKLQFLERLQQWYKKPGGTDSVFHIERFKTPGISEEDIINTIIKVSENMLRSKVKEDYWQDYENCRSYYGDECPYIPLCFEGGETKENLVLYQIRKSYHVSKENKRAEDE